MHDKLKQLIIWFISLIYVKISYTMNNKINDYCIKLITPLVKSGFKTDIEIAHQNSP